MQFDGDFFLKLVFQPSPALIGGLIITVAVSIFAQAVGVVLGVAVGPGRAWPATDRCG